MSWSSYYAYLRSMSEIAGSLPAMQFRTIILYPGNRVSRFKYFFFKLFFLIIYTKNIKIKLFMSVQSFVVSYVHCASLDFGRREAPSAQYVRYLVRKVKKNWHPLP